MNQHGEIFTKEKLLEFFPPERTEAFFEALFGDAEDGSYDISLHYVGQGEDALDFEFHLDQRPGRCLACNLTYGLPQVFTRHPVINVNGVADAIAEAVGGSAVSWELGATRELSRELHVIPLKVLLG